MSKVYLVTGANSGLGYDASRKLALLKDTQKVYLACRSEKKAKDAINKLVEEAGVPLSKLMYVHFDACAPKEELAKIVEDVEEPLDGIILNAGGIGHDKTGKPQGPNNVVEIYQMNLIGNIQIVNFLDDAKKLTKGCRVIYSGSELARGVPMMGMKNPHMKDTSTWYEEQLKGETTSKKKGKPFNSMLAYSKVKGVAALYWAAWARHHTEYHVLVVSPGGTSGTEAMSTDAVPAHFRVMMPVMMPVMKTMGVMHSLDLGSQRYVDAVLGQGEMAKFPSGTFVASKSGTTGPVADQTTTKPGRKYGDKEKQEAAFEALSLYVQAS